MKTIDKTLQVFQFTSENDIFTEVFEKAFEKNAYNILDFDIQAEIVLDYVIETLETFGVDVKENSIQYLLESPGSFFSFEGNYSYQKNWKKKIKEQDKLGEELFPYAEKLAEIQKKYFYNLQVWIKTSPNAGNSMPSTYYTIEDYLLYRDVDHLESEFREIFWEMNETIRIFLENAMQTYYSKKNFLETCIANEYTFDIDGNFV